MIGILVVDNASWMNVWCNGKMLLGSLSIEKYVEALISEHVWVDKGI
jgi:hypothetical protein